MVVLNVDRSSKIFEIDESIFEDTKEYLQQLSSDKKVSFSYIDDIGDKIVVIDGKEYVEPTIDDLKAIYDCKKQDFVDSEEVFKELGIDV